METLNDFDKMSLKTGIDDWDEAADLPEEYLEARGRRKARRAAKRAGREAGMSRKEARKAVRQAKKRGLSPFSILSRSKIGKVAASLGVTSEKIEDVIGEIAATKGVEITDVSIPEVETEIKKKKILGLPPIAAYGIGIALVSGIGYGIYKLIKS